MELVELVPVPVELLTGQWLSGYLFDCFSLKVAKVAFLLAATNATFFS